MMANTSFAATVAQWVADVKGAQEVVFKEATQDLVAEVQKPGPSVAATKAAIRDGIGTYGRGKSKKQLPGPVAAPGAGGRMPVDTGFLRASLRASTAAPPPIDKDFLPAEGKTYNFNSGSIETVIAGSEIGDTVYLCYTAAYARAMEYGSGGGPAYAFVRTTAQRWQSIVDEAAARTKARLGL